MTINFIKFIYVIADLWFLKHEISLGVINIELKNGNIEKQSGELNIKFSVMRKCYELVLCLKI
jgi:hypothetical protein